MTTNKCDFYLKVDLLREEEEEQQGKRTIQLILSVDFVGNNLAFKCFFLEVRKLMGVFLSNFLILRFSAALSSLSFEF